MATTSTDIYTIQSNIKKHTNADIVNYALFLGGMNATHEVLAQYDPLITGYSRIFMVREPVFLAQNLPVAFPKFKHMLQYANTAIQAASDMTLDENQLTGGYVGNSFGIPTVAKSGLQEFSITLYETSGSLIREVIHTWINGMRDIQTGLCHYNGVAGDDDVPVLQANQTAEFIFVSTDVTGEKVEYATLLANCWPKNIKNDQFNYNTGEHNLVEYQIQFDCCEYQSLQINAVAQELINRYKVLGNSLNFYSGYDISSAKVDTTLGKGSGYDIRTGKIVSADSSDYDADYISQSEPTNYWTQSV